MGEGTREFPDDAFRTAMASRFWETVGLETCSRQQSGVGNSGGIQLKSDRSLFSQRLPQFFFGRFNFALSLITKQDRAQFLALIITRQKLFLGVGAAEIDPSRLQAEISDKVQPQIEHLRPEIRDLFVANSFFACHVRSRNQALRSRVLPMRLAAHSTHDAIGIKCQISNGKNSFLLCFEIFCDRRAVRAGKRRIADEIEVWFGAASDYGQSGRNAVPTFRLDISQHRLAFETI